MLSFGLALSASALRGPSWSPRALFPPGTSGLWLDPSQRPALFQDAAGTIPAIAPSDPVGLVRDLGGRGNHASQATAAARPTLARHPASGLRQLLPVSTSFAPWSGIAASGVAGAAIGAGGALTMSKLIENTEDRAHYLQYFLTTTVGKAYTLSVVAKAAERSVLQLLLPASAFGSNMAGFFDLTNGASIIRAGASGGAIPLGDGFYRCWVSAPASAEVSVDLQIRAHTTYADTLAGYQGDGVSGLYIDTPQIEVGAAPTPYQAATSVHHVTEAGHGDVWGLRFDGIDDWLATTGLIWGSDAMTVVYAARKLGDATKGVIAEYGLASSDGSWTVGLPGALGRTWDRYGWAYSRGTSNVGAGIAATNTQYAGPLTMVGSYRARIGTDTLIPRLNGLDLPSATGYQGSSDYASRPLRIGISASGGAPFLGTLYGLLVVNQLLSVTDLARAEAWMAARCGVILP